MPTRQLLALLSLLLVASCHSVLCQTEEADIAVENAVPASSELEAADRREGGPQGPENNGKKP